jgi:hypothetical protein
MEDFKLSRRDAELSRRSAFSELVDVQHANEKEQKEPRLSGL